MCEPPAIPGTGICFCLCRLEFPFSWQHTALTPGTSLAASMPAPVLPEIRFHVGEVCFQFTLAWKARRNSHKTCSPCTVADVGLAIDPTPMFSCKNDSCTQAQSRSPSIPNTAPPNPTSQHLCGGCSRPQVEVTVVALHSPIPQCHG